MIDIDKELGLFSIDKVLEYTKPYSEDEYTGKDVYETEELYRMHLFLTGYEDSNENRNIFHKRMLFHNFPDNIAFI